MQSRQTSYIGENTVNADVISIINDFMDGTIGIPSSIDTQLWARDYAEIDKSLSRAEREANEAWASRGETMPAGILSYQLAMARQEATKARNAVVRERMIKRNEWQIENYKSIINSGIAFLEMERKQFVALNQLSETLAYHAFDVSEKIIRIELAAKELSVNTWKAHIASFDTWLRAELAELEKVKAELEIQRLIGQINNDLLEQYKARLQGISLRYDLYKSKIESLNLIIAQDKLRFDAYESEVRAYVAQVEAHSKEWEGFGHAVDGELGRAKIYETMAQAFAERMKGFQTKKEIERYNEALKIDDNKVKIDLLGKRIAKYDSDVRGETARIDALVRKMALDADIYKTKSAAELGRIEAETRLWEGDIKRAEIDANLTIKAQEVAINEMLAIKNILLQALDAVARTESNLAAAAMSAANVSASIQGQSTDSTSCSTSYNVSVEE